MLPKNVLIIEILLLHLHHIPYHIHLLLPKRDKAVREMQSICHVKLRVPPLWLRCTAHVTDASHSTEFLNKEAYCKLQTELGHILVAKI